MHTEARLRRSPWISLVGLSPSDGSGWSQAPDTQEKAQGYKKTDVMNLQLLCSALRAAVEDLLSQVDPTQTDAGSLAALKALDAKVTSLETEVAVLATQSSLSKFKQLTAAYNALAAEFAGYGIQVATAPAAAPSGGGPAVAVPPVTVQAAATPASPVITKKNASSTWADYFLYAAIGLGVIATGYGLKLWKF